MPEQDFYAPGDLATVTLLIDDINNLLGLGARLHYDATRLRFDDGSLAPGAFLDDGSTVEFENDDDAGTLALSSTRTSGISAIGSGIVMTMTFTVLDGAPSGGRAPP